ncbi:TetR/AcrR family transcriptional regulator [Aquimarina sp. M1]|uniref:TetR/AcrR family transcriptional regulator n=1 Tax=Dokdonia genika TaxID=308113 RepID=A0ABV9L8K4_9FLAO
MRDKIIEKSTEMFLIRGSKGLTMDTIAYEMGISKKTIYKYFNTKRELVEAGSEYLFHKITDGIDKIIELNENPIKEMFLIRDFVFYVLKSENTSPYHQFKKYFPEIYQSLMTRQFAEMDRCITKNLKKGMEQGLYCNEINIKLISRFFFIGVNNIKDQNIFNLKHFTALEINEAYLNFYLRAICTQKGLDYLNNHKNL